MQYVRHHCMPCSLMAPPHQNEIIKTLVESDEDELSFPKSHIGVKNTYSKRIGHGFSAPEYDPFF